MSFPPSRAFPVAALATSLVVSAVTADAVESLGLRVADLGGERWRAEDIRAGLTLTPGGGARLLVEVASLVLAPPLGTVSHLRLECPQVDWTPRRLACKEGTLSASHPLLQAPRMGARFTWEGSTASLDLEGVRIADGKLDIALRAGGGDGSAHLYAVGVKLATLTRIFPLFAPQVADWVLEGEVDLDLDLHAAKGVPDRVAWDAHLHGGELSDPRGGVLGQGLALAAKGTLERRQRYWEGSSRVELTRGELLTPAFYLAPGPSSVRVEADLRLGSDSGDLSLRNLRYRHPGVLAFDAGVELRLNRPALLQRLQLTARDLPADPVYRQYLQPLAGTGTLGDLTLGGTVGIDVDYGAVGPARIGIDLSGVSVAAGEAPGRKPAEAGPTEAAGRFAFEGVSGRLIWTRDAPGERSILRWQRGQVLEKIELGPAELELDLSGDGVRLAREAVIPVFDGSLIVHRLAYAPAAGDAGGLEVAGVLTPVSMERISRALGWPPLSGQLSGVIPSVSYRSGGLQVDGNLLVRAFDGDVLVRNLRMEDLFGTWPVVTADVELRNLDLEMLTGTFAFGKITGKLEGRIDGLRLEDWTPVAFDARFATPAGDESRHRISQRAVDNIADLGGAGVSGAVSRGLLRYFDEFGYSRLGISCRLRDGVCEMGGVRSAGEGYYLVEGGGIPRIEILGFNRHTDWNLLVQQLREITRAQTPIVE